MALNKAHTLAKLAEEQADQGKLLAAVSTRQQAAAAYTTASQATTDASATAMLLNLSAAQTKHAGELQWRIDISSHKSDPAPSRTAGQSHRHGHLGPRQPTAPRRSTTAPAQPSRLQQSVASSASSRLSPSSSLSSGESFSMVRSNASEADPFSQFMRIIDDLQDKLTKPVAFASAPISGKLSPDRRKVTSDEIDRLTESFLLVPREVPAAFLVRPQAEERPVQMLANNQRTVEELLIENASLKSALDRLAKEHERQKKLIARQSEERDSIKQSVLDLSQQVRRSVDSQPFTAQKTDLARIAKLEMERADLEKAAAEGAKYKMRYNALREAIKKRRAAKDTNKDSAHVVDTN
ncbi:uncharacterized protein L969DRAFT_85731 [Mixia osmundae IAM 14324]|uniref:Uncharacterized protein n=1 Tax=Mixia osmundae (strain CBS 9802 / IAM 14324 / JCM 22182 / KY 12970) TaxID=764103 RepID=G7E640_MIXOS|nr:uncharacterized protein L969DRAFT_85731 [Mixia osmundae IAM 14324]KEI40547.1 hypothetical protein L969DRAFT_85731 [Mixia osmundae IAM 14324]GAA98300.1 hypothetical protein E5Q_04984 [Mixia osmundae IAM 14324]